MSRLVLVRHAATEWSGARFCGRTDLPLSDAGRAQATHLGERLARSALSVATVRSSPAHRALETAEPLARAFSVALGPDDRLREVDFGLAEGCSFEDVGRRWPRIAAALLAADAAIDWPEGERADEVLARLRPVASELETLEDDAVLVTHGGTIRALLQLLGISRIAEVDLAPAQLLVLRREPVWHRVEQRFSDEQKGAHVR